ncbi:MAG TPA: DUF1189 domain-containing protein [Thermodesulfovibrionales bacterium]|nr:DUF1189 domain-containing protein [Thermodesulfovibrionales bacterium]
MRRYTTVHPLFMSFYSRSLYRDVGKNWRKISFLYLLLLTAVCTIPFVFKTHSLVSGYLSREGPKIVEQIPVITITKGTVSVDKPMPYVIKDPESNAPLAIIDTTGQVTSLKGSPAIALLTKRELIIRRGPTETWPYDLSEIENLVIDRSRMYDWMETFVGTFAYVLYPLALLSSFLFRTILALCLAVSGMFFARRLKVSLGYRACLSLAIVSMTPTILLNTLHTYLGMRIPLSWLISTLISLGYLYFAVKANSGPETSETVP